MKRINLSWNFNMKRSKLEFILEKYNYDNCHDCNRCMLDEDFTILRGKLREIDYESNCLGKINISCCSYKLLCMYLHELNKTKLIEEILRKILKENRVVSFYPCKRTSGIEYEEGKDFFFRLKDKLEKNKFELEF